MSSLSTAFSGGLSMPLTGRGSGEYEAIGDEHAMRIDDVGGIDAAELQRVTERYQEEGLVSYQQGHTAGLSDVEAAARFDIVGPNESGAPPSAKVSAARKFVSFFTAPMPCLLWFAILIEFLVAHWVAFGALCALQLMNGAISFHCNLAAGRAVAALKQQLAAQALVKRSGSFHRVRARQLVPGDIVLLAPGDIVPADCKIVESSSGGGDVDGDGAGGAPMMLEIDQGALTGESLPVTAGCGDKVLMGATVVRGELEAMVLWTGRFTFHGRAAELVGSVRARGRFEVVVFRIVLALLGVALALLSAILVVLLVGNNSGEGMLTAVEQCVVVLVAAVPFAVQVLSTSTMAAGAMQLAEKNVICTRLSVIEEMAEMDLLCADKTGTLTQNSLELADMVVIDETLSPHELVLYGALACKREAKHGAGAGEPVQIDAVDRCIVDAVHECPTAEFGAAGLAEWEELSFQPFDRAMKRATALVVRRGVERSTHAFLITKSAPQVALRMAHNCAEIEAHVSAIVQEMADRGHSALSLARTEPGDTVGLKWIFCGVLALNDLPRFDTQPTIKTAIEMGVEVKMVTGDQTAIAKETARVLGMGTNLVNAQVLTHGSGVVPGHNAAFRDIVRGADGLAEMEPEHKLQVVDVLVGEGFAVGVTGDRVGDAPALKKAHVGIALEGATDAARAAADIVLTEPGLSVIVDALLCSRKIFARVRHYAIFRVTTTLQLCISLFIMVLCFEISDSWTTFERTMRTSNGPIFDYNSDVPRTETRFTLPVIALVLITIFNDGCILAVAKDKVRASKKPQGWNLKEVYAISSCLAFSLVVECVILGVGCLATGNLYNGNTIGCGQWGVETGVSSTQQYCGPNFAVDARASSPFYRALNNSCPVNDNNCFMPATKSPTGVLVDISKCLTSNAKSCDPLWVLSRSNVSVLVTAAGEKIKLDPMAGSGIVGTQQLFHKFCNDSAPLPGIVQATKASGDPLFAATPYAHGCSNMMGIFCASYTHQKPCTGTMNRLLGDPERGNLLGYQQFKAAIFMVVALSAFLTIFAARSRDNFFVQRPGAALVAMSLAALALTTLVCGSMQKDSSLGMQPISHALGMIWAYVIFFFLFEDLLAKAACYKMLSLLTISDDVKLIKTMARKEASTASAENQKHTRTDIAIDGSSLIGAGRVPSLLTDSLASRRLRAVENKLVALQHGTVLRQRVQ